ncbi:MAG: glycosyltransferase family 2 protein [Rhodospirillaceae bacterium]|nr:glycosyltransferase family 2 protein [Rhodospirillaceae bacterium]
MSDKNATHIAVVIPCFRETKRILDVIKSIGEEVSRIIVIDDACPDNTGEHVKKQCMDKRVEVLIHDTNTGVGGATMSGYKRAIEAGAEIIVKVDGDGQMDPSLIPDLVAPLLEGVADYAKGNRFYNLDGLADMPRVRIFGNLVLSFASKISSGYWNIFDPTNGFTAIHIDAARRLPFEKIDNGFFFESDMLFRLNMMRGVVVDIPMPARYGDEESSLKIHNIIVSFAARHYVNAAKRIFYNYFIRDFGVASIELVLGKLLLLFGVVYGIYSWSESAKTGIPATAGTVILAALPIILGSQMLMAFLNFDTKNVPTKPLNHRAP